MESDGSDDHTSASRVWRGGCRRTEGTRWVGGDGGKTSLKLESVANGDRTTRSIEVYRGLKQRSQRVPLGMDRFLTLDD